MSPLYSWEKDIIFSLTLHLQGIFTTRAIWMKVWIYFSLDISRSACMFCASWSWTRTSTLRHENHQHIKANGRKKMCKKHEALHNSPLSGYRQVWIDTEWGICSRLQPSTQLHDPDRTLCLLHRSLYSPEAIFTVISTSINSERRPALVGGDVVMQDGIQQPKMWSVSLELSLPLKNRYSAWSIHLKHTFHTLKKQSTGREEVVPCQ